MATRKVRDQRRQVRRHDGYRRTCGYNYKRCQGSDSGGHGAVASSDSHAATVHGPGARTDDGSARSAWPGRAGGHTTNGHGQGTAAEHDQKTRYGSGATYVISPLTFSSFLLKNPVHRHGSKHQCHLPTCPLCCVCIYHVLIGIERYSCCSGLVTVDRGITSALEIYNANMWSHGGQRSLVIQNWRLSEKRTRLRLTVHYTYFLATWSFPHAPQLFPTNRTVHHILPVAARNASLSVRCRKGGTRAASRRQS